MCGLALTAYHKLPAAEGFDPTDSDVALAPEDTPVPLTSLRFHGALIGVAVTGLVLFFLPWIDVEFPFVLRLRGFDFARATGWTWAVPAAWFVLIPTALSRRTQRRMQSARVAIGMLAMFPALSVGMLLLNPPRGAYGLKPRFDYLWALYGTLTLSVLGVVLAALFGFSLTTLRRSASEPTKPAEPAKATKNKARAKSAKKRTLH